MGTGFATGEGRAMDAVHAALESPLLDSNDIFGTKNILLNIISGSEEIRIGEIGEIIEALQEKAGQEADIIWGNGYDDRLGDKISVTILATGFVTNPNRVLQPKQETQKFDLDEEQKKEREKNFAAFQFDDEPVEEPVTVDEEPEETIIVRPPVKSTFRKKEKREKKEKKRKNQPVTESNVDNWFFKNFGLSKLFDEDDQSMD